MAWWNLPAIGNAGDRLGESDLVSRFVAGDADAFTQNVAALFPAGRPGWRIA